LVIKFLLDRVSSPMCWSWLIDITTEWSLSESSLTKRIGTSFGRPVDGSFRRTQIARIQPPVHFRGAFGLSGPPNEALAFNAGRRTLRFLAKLGGLFWKPLYIWLFEWASFLHGASLFAWGGSANGRSHHR
jgi:hypothetical protein